MIEDIDNPQVQQNNPKKCLRTTLIFSLTQKYPNHSFAQAFNSNNTLITFGAKFVCKVIFQKNEKFKYLLHVKSHSNVISTLNFFKDSSLLISGSYDKCIIISSYNLLSSPKYMTKLKGHTHIIQCLVVNKNQENFFISGSADSKIKFWSFSSSSCWNCTQTISEHFGSVNGLSLNQESTQLISCGTDKQILIIERSADQIWYVKQKISERGYRISFITNNIFSFQPCDGTHLFIYTFDHTIGLYIKSKEIAISKGGERCQPYFPQVYIPSKQLLVSKNVYFVNLIKINFNLEQLNCNVEEEIKFDQLGNFGNIFGTISSNGEYLIIWDCKTGCLQIRKLIYEQQEK